MQRFLLYLALGLLLIGGFAMYYYSPSVVVERHTRKLLDLATIESGTGKAGRSLRSLSFDKLIGETVVISSSEEKLNKTFDRSDLSTQFQLFCQYIDQSSFTTEDISIELMGRTSARARLSIDADVRSEFLSETKTFTGYFDFEKSDEHGWVLTSALLDETQ